MRFLLATTLLFLAAACGGGTPMDVAGTSSSGGSGSGATTGVSSTASSGTSSGSTSGGTTGTTTSAWVGPSCHTDANCNGGQSGTDNVCGSDGHCVVGCHAVSDCSAGNRCDIPDGGSPGMEGTCTNADTAQITIPATDGTFDVPGPVHVAGQGTDEIGAIQITDNLGTIDFEGDAVPAIVYEIQPFGSETLYQLMGVESNALLVVWAYCQSGELVDLYRETSDGVAVTYETASGTCGDSGSDASVHLSLPGFTLAPPPGLVQGVSMTGATLTYDGGSPGQLVSGGAAWTVFPFNTVDCSSCGTPGWFEVHSVLWDAADSEAGFGIFYLIDGKPGTIQLSYSLILPTLGSLDQVLHATWSHP